MRMTMRLARGARRALTLAPAVVLSACSLFPAPVPPVALTKPEVAAIAKCQKAIEKGQLGYVKAEESGLAKCVDGVLAIRLPFENGLTTQEDFDAGLVKMRDKCTKSFAKITAASTKFIDAVVKACTPVETAVLGPYDALRFQSLFGTFSTAPTTTVQLAGQLCALAINGSYAHVGGAAPRLMELLTYLGPTYVQMSDMDSGFPNVPHDPRCAPPGPPEE